MLQSVQLRVCATDCSPDMENYWEDDDDDSFSSEQEVSDPRQVIDSPDYLLATHTCLTVPKK